MNTQRGAISLLVIALIAIVLGGGAYFAATRGEIKTEAITSFEECMVAGYPIMESYPRQCAVPGEASFTEVLTGDAACAAVSCLVGSTCVNGQCIPNEQTVINSNNPCMTVRCMAGYYCDSANGKCVQEKQTTTPSRCAPPCTGMPPSADVEQDCRNTKTESACNAYQSKEFPFRCDWRPVDYICPAYP